MDSRADFQAAMTLEYTTISRLIGMLTLAITSINWCCSVLLTRSAVRSQARALASHSAKFVREMLAWAAAVRVEKWMASSCSYLFEMSFLLSFTNSYQTDVASGAGQTRANIHANSWTCNAVGEDVAAAQIEVPSTPLYAANMLFDGSVELFPEAPAISETRRPYDFISFGVAGQMPSNNAPSLLAVI